jgi:hypothetical protein
MHVHDVPRQHISYNSHTGCYFSAIYPTTAIVYSRRSVDCTCPTKELPVSRSHWIYAS